MNSNKIKRKIKISDPCLSNKKLTQKNRKYNMKCEINKGYHINNEEIYKENPDLQNSGKIFNSSDPEFQISGKHLKDPLYKKYNTFSEPTCASTYIYIISKVIDNDIYYKIGEGGKGTSKGVGRLSEAQTYLMPGLNEQSGFKVHYVFFFRKSLYLNSLFIGQHIEKTIHSGTHVSQNETSVAPREASKSESQKRSETTVAPREASCQISSECFVIFCRPA